METQLPPAAEQDDPVLQMRDMTEKVSYIKSVLQKIGEYVHPNHITASRVPLTIATTALHALGLPLTSVGVHTVNALLDWLDGAVARATPGLSTARGGRLDPFTDKLCAQITLIYQTCQQIDLQNLATLDATFAAAAGFNLLCDFISLLVYGNPVDQAKDAYIAVTDTDAPDGEVSRKSANYIGKISTAVQLASMGLMFGWNESDWAVCTAIVGLTAGGAARIWSALKKISS